MAKLDKVVEIVLQEGLVDDAAELVGIEKDEAAERIEGLSFANYLELGNAIDIEDVETAREILGTVSPIEEEVVTEVAPPGMEGWIKKRKPEFKERYGDRWEEVLYATAWKQHNNESVEEGVVDEEKLLDKPTPTLKDLAKKHDMSLGDIGAQLAKGIKAEKEHTSDMLVAKEIALDHLNELPDYYTKLEKMEEDAAPSDNLYHVTHTKYVPKIQQNGLRPMGSASNWVQQGSGDRYGMGEIYIFTSREDAKKWAGRMDWEFNQTIGSGEISIITLNRPEGHDFEKDEADPMSQAGQQGEWLKTYEPIEPENIVDVQVFKSMNEADNPYAAPKASAPPAAVPPSTAASSIDALAQPNATAQEVDNEENQRKEVDDLAVGDDIEVIDISGDPTPVTVKNPRGPGETLIVQTDKGEEHMIKKMAVSGTPKLQELAENFEKELDEMRAGDFDDALRKTPSYVAVFQVTKVPAWAEEYVDKGDLVYWSNKGDTLVRVKGGAIGLTATAVTFVGHYRFSDVLDGNIGAIKEDSIEEAELNEDYYDSEGEGASLTRDLATYGWIVYISWSRDDLDYALYKNIDKDNNRGDYRFLKVDKATGSWQTQRSKYNDAMATESGDAAELMHVIKAIEASATVEEGQNANKTEHSGAKKGKGAYYGQKKTAKRDSNKKRRADDKKAVNEAESFFFFIDPDERGGALVMSSKGDIHDYYEDMEEAMQEARRLNAEFGKDNEGNPIGVNESVLSDHVKVEYKDPAGRFIVVTAGGAGHWAVGKGNPYGSGIEQWSHNNLDDAIKQADADADDLDNLREMKRMAGIQETSSAGATGAGAVAVGAVAPFGVGGSKPIKRRVSGEPSIYGKTNKKPKPKERAKESTEDGIGRNKK